MVNRRSFLKIISSMAVTAIPSVSVAVPGKSSGARVVIIGAGIAGFRTAVRLKQTLPATDITLIEPAGSAQEKSLTKINHTVMLEPLDSLALTGIKRVSQRVVEVDPVSKRVRLQDGSTVDGDLLVLAPGVEFKNNNGVHPLNDAGLQRQLEAMQQGSTVIVGIPQAPYQYPHGPYNAITDIANYLHTRKPGSKVIVFDHNQNSSLAALYRRQWSRVIATAGIEHIEVAPGYVQAVDHNSGSIKTADGSVNAGVIALMDQQRAASVARDAGLAGHHADQGDWCQVNLNTLESFHYTNVYVLGDANDAAQENKTAITAVQQADTFVRAVASKIA